MYRAVTWLALRRGIQLDDEESLVRLAQTAEIFFQQNDDGLQRVYCQGHDITEEIRSPGISRAVSKVAAIQGVREALVDAQRRLASGRDVVMDGRDIGTVVLPEAECKIFLTAAPEERARRRMEERKGRDEGGTLEGIKRDIIRRDLEDTNRKTGPLVQAGDSVLIDTTSMSLREAIDETLRIVRSALKGAAEYTPGMESRQ